MDSVFVGPISLKLFHSDDFLYCQDLGLVKEDEFKKLRPSNAAYKEVMSRVITPQIPSALAGNIPKLPWTDGKIIFMNRLLQDFQNFWQEHSRPLTLGINSLDLRESASIYLDDIDAGSKDIITDSMSDRLAPKYSEEAFNFTLLAYLQKVDSVGAIVHPEFALGRGAVDICVLFHDRKYLIEINVQGQKSLEGSLKQLAKYLDNCGEKEGWLVILDYSIKKKRGDKIYFQTIKHKNYTINIFGC
jgi:hypothetical protein